MSIKDHMIKKLLDTQNKDMANLLREIVGHLNHMNDNMDIINENLIEINKSITDSRLQISAIRNQDSDKNETTKDNT